MDIFIIMKSTVKEMVIQVITMTSIPEFVFPFLGHLFF